jgi:hypothetical protein
MATNEERLKVLKMVQEGKLTPAEADELLSSLDASAAVAGSAGDLTASRTNTGRGQKFHVRVTDTNTGKVRVNVRMPLNVITAGLKMGVKFSPEVEGLDIEQLSQFIQSGEVGQIVDVFDEEDGEHVEVFIE